MSLPSFFLLDAEEADHNPGSASSLTVSAEEYHHMCAMRIEPGEHVRLARTDGSGFEAALACELKDARSVGDDAVGLDFQIVAALCPSWVPRLTLVQGISKGDRFEQVVRQATELGVRRIVPLMSERCIVRLDEKKATSKTARWRSVAASAAKQSGMLAIPELTGPLDLDEAIEAVSDADALVIPWEEASGRSMHDALAQAPSDAQVALFVGPEGGFSAAEVEQVCARGGVSITLGHTILRTETAGVVASALALYELGGLGRRAEGGISDQGNL